MKRQVSIGVTVLLVVVLAGCGAAGLLQLFGLVQLGRLAGQLASPFEGEDPTDYRVYMDGYDIGSSPGPSGDIDLNGLPHGVHLVSITTADKHRGWHQLLEIAPDQTANIGQINPFEGATIAGTVSRQTVDSGTSLLRGVRVVAVKDAAILLRAGVGSPIDVPPQSAASSLTYLMGYTDDQGRYTLGPAQYGDYIVFVAGAGYFSDAAFVHVEYGQDATAVDLVLEHDGSQNPGTVGGAVSVAREGERLLTARLSSPYPTPISPTLRQQIEQDSGQQLISQPWCHLYTLTTLSNNLGHYNLDLPAGRHNLQAFMFDFKAKEVDVNVDPGGQTPQDFHLEHR